MGESIYFSLDREINTQRLINEIQNLINKAVNKNNKSPKILQISIKTISNETNELIPRLEYKDERT